MTEKPKSFVLHSTSIIIALVAFSSLLIMMGQPAGVFAPPAPPSQSSAGFSSDRATILMINETDNINPAFNLTDKTSLTANEANISPFR